MFLWSDRLKREHDVCCFKCKARNVSWTAAQDANVSGVEKVAEFDTAATPALRWGSPRRMQRLFDNVAEDSRQKLCLIIYIECKLRNEFQVQRTARCEQASITRARESQGRAKHVSSKMRRLRYNRSNTHSQKIQLFPKKITTRTCSWRYDRHS